jgi:hypothetical protein
MIISIVAHPAREGGHVVAVVLALHRRPLALDLYFY